MRFVMLCALAFTGGVFLAIQAGFNSQLGALLRQPILAAVATYITGTLLGMLAIPLLGKNALQPALIQQVPWYLWFGGLFSMAGLLLYFYTIPQLGISKMIALGLCGQLVFSLVAGHFGWLNLPVEPIAGKKAVGALAMIIGIILINTK